MTTQPHRRHTARLLIFLLGTLSAGVHADPLLDDARRLLDAGQGADALSQLTPHQAERAGEAEFDYLLATAALRAGKPALAVFGLERVLQARPDDTSAHIMLGHALFLMREDEAARQAFRAALETRPQPQAQATIERYLDAIERRRAHPEHTFSAYVETGAGYDTNIESTTSATSLVVPLYGLEVPLDPEYTQRKDSLLRLRGGIDYSTPIATTTRFFVNGNGEVRRHATHPTADTDNLALQAGLHFHAGRNRLTAAAQAQQLAVDDSRNRDIAGLALQWQHTLDASNELTAGIQHAAIRYPDQDTRDVDRQSAGLTWSHALNRTGKPILSLGGYGGRDTEQDDTQPQNGQTFWGIRGGLDVSLTQRTSLRTLLTYQRGRYGDDDPYFLETREDTLADIHFLLNFRVDAQWSIRHELRYTRNDSNIPLFDYERVQHMLSARWEYR